MGLSTALESTSHLSDSADWLKEFTPTLNKVDSGDVQHHQHSLAFSSLAVFGNAQVSFTYDELISATRQTINAFNLLNVGKNEPVSILLPHIPQAYYAIWAAETLGIAHPINPKLPAEKISLTLASTKPRILVTLGPLPGIDIWDKAIDALGKVSSIQKILVVDLRVHLSNTSKVMSSIYSSIDTFLNRSKSRRSIAQKYEILDFGELIAKQQGNRLPQGVQFNTQRINRLFELDSS